MRNEVSTAVAYHQEVYNLETDRHERWFLNKDGEFLRSLDVGPLDITRDSEGNVLSVRGLLLEGGYGDIMGPATPRTLP